MDKVDKNSKDIQQTDAMPTTFEQLEVRRALGGESVKTLDANAEWNKFRRLLPVGTTAGYSGKKTNRTRFYGMVAALAAAVAAVLVIVVLPRHGGDLEVITANNAGKDIVVSSDDGERRMASTSKPIVFNIPPVSANGEAEKPRQMQVSTPRGKACEVVLPDGTHVWLNAESTISFPSRFTGGKRNVKVSGEGYFEVVKNARKPFVVSTEWFTTKVLGTSFNLRAYSAADASVVLVGGSVGIKAADGSEKVLSPGQKATVAADGVSITDVDTYALTQWKEGFFYFDNASLADIMMSIGRWYNVSVVFEHEQDMGRRLHLVAGHDESLADILGRINSLGVVKCRLNGDLISIE